jgi:hypothetical protein
MNMNKSMKQLETERTQKNMQTSGRSESFKSYQQTNLKIFQKQSSS